MIDDPEVNTVQPLDHETDGHQSIAVPALTRRAFTTLGSAMAGAVAMVALGTDRLRTAVAEHVTGSPTIDRPPPEADTRVFSQEETTLAFRCHGMQDEFLDRPITPLGAHFLLIHFDVPDLKGEDYSLAIGGHVQTPLVVGLDELKSRPSVAQVVTMECAGTGRSTMSLRAIYVPWKYEAIGTYE